MIDAVTNALAPTELKAGWIAYNGVCTPGETSGGSLDSIRIPAIAVDTPPAGSVGLDALRFAFHRARHVSIALSHSGVIRVTIGDVDDRILQTQISELVLTPMQQYNARLALHALEEAPDMVVAMRRLNLREKTGIEFGGMGEPMNNVPHLPPVLKGLTADAILDSAALTFHGIVLYGSCRHSSVFGLQFSFVN